jgi:isoquinoline 1-oxidoreductase subunit alpha
VSFTVNINGQDRSVDLPGDMPLLWVLRDELGLTGTKFGCGMAVCGACTVQVDGAAVRACSYPLSAVGQAKVVTIEAIGETPIGAALQQAWLDHDVMQCGYCQAGQIMAAAALLKEQPKISRAEAAQGMAGNICRCACYNRIGDAVAEVAAKLGGTGNARA